METEATSPNCATWCACNDGACNSAVRIAGRPPRPDDWCPDHERFDDCETVLEVMHKPMPTSFVRRCASTSDWSIHCGFIARASFRSCSRCFDKRPTGFKMRCALCSAK